MATRREPVVDVLVTSASQVVYRGAASSVVFPGEQGTFEVLPLHRPLVSRLVAGPLIIDQRTVMIRRGVVRVADDTVTAVVEVSGR